MNKKNLVKFFEQTAEKLTIWHVLLVGLALTAFSVIYQHGGVLHPELELRLPYYLSDRPLLTKMFDSRSVVDSGLYRARELSYVFDYIDSQFIALGVRLGLPHFLSLIHYIFVILIGCILWQFSVRKLKLNAWAGLCLALLWWTSPTVLLSSSFFRTAKIGVALTTVILYFYVYKVIEADRQNREYHLPASHWWICFTISFASALLDEQGFFTLGLFAAFLVLWVWAFGNTNLYKLLGALAASFALSLIYRFYAAPYLTFLLNQYWPSFAYQQLPWAELLSDESIFYFGAGPVLYLETLCFLIGNIPAAIMALLLAMPIAVILAAYIKQTGPERAEHKTFWITFAGLVLTNIILMIAMYTLMVIRHPALFFMEVRVGGYYFLPATAMFGMTLAFLLSRVVKIQSIPKWIILVLLFLAIIGNVIAIPQHKAILENGFMQPYFEASQKLLDALKNIDDSQFPITPDIERDPVYQFFRNNP
jgi:hypothetical protein